MSDPIIDFIQFLQEADRIEELGNAWLALAAVYGFTTGFALDVQKLARTISPAWLFGHDGGEIAFDRQDRFVHHPVYKRAQETDRPFRLDDLRQRLNIDPAVWKTRLPPDIRNLTAVVLPVHRGGSLRMFFACAGAAPDDSPAAQAVLHACAHMVFDRVRAFKSMPPSDDRLSKREAQCLHWVGQGKTDAEIGRLLDIAERTVRFHLTNAKRKLKVDTRLQAIAKKVGASHKREAG